MKKVAVSIGDINGISLELIVKNHELVSKFAQIYYIIHQDLLEQGLRLLNLELKNARLVFFEHAKKLNFKRIKKNKNYEIFLLSACFDYTINHNFKINPGEICKNSGLYSFLSFHAGLYLSKYYNFSLLTMPIHKKAWSKANICYIGHTDMIRAFLKKEVIMMLGCDELFVGLFSEHIALKDVYKKIKFKELSEFLLNFYLLTKFENIGVVGFNPHCGDFGLIGTEEKIIQKAVNFTNAFLACYENLQTNTLKQEFKKALASTKIQNQILKTKPFRKIFLENLLVADTAFTKHALKKCNRLVVMYHDLALAPLKALYFEKSINISLNDEIKRASVDHGTAFDKAYKKQKLSSQSYIQAIKYLSI